MKQCDQCQRELSEDCFLRVKPGWQCTKCNNCAQENMRNWGNSRAGLPDHIAKLD